MTQPVPRIPNALPDAPMVSQLGGLPVVSFGTDELVSQDNVCEVVEMLQTQLNAFSAQVVAEVQSQQEVSGGINAKLIAMEMTNAEFQVQAGTTVAQAQGVLQNHEVAIQQLNTAAADALAKCDC